MWTFLLYLFVALQVAALIGGVVTRRWPIKPQPLVWRGTSVEFAATQIQALLYDIDDGRFAYPTGQFVPVGAESDHGAGRVVMDEANFKGSKGFGMVFHLFAMAGAMTRGVADESAAMAFVVGLIAFWFATLLAAPFLVASVIDVVFRRLYRSRITADVRAHPTIGDAVTVDLRFRGLSAFGIVGDVMRAGAAPSAPDGSREASATATEGGSSRARAAVWAGAAERRSSLVYGSGVGASLLVAGVLALALPHPFAGSGGSGYYDTTSADYSGADSGSSGEDEVTTDDGATDESGDGSSEPSLADGTYASSAGSFTVVPPAGWVLDSEDTSKGGYYETRWHLPGSPEVYALMNYTPGFSGTALEGARGVRKLVSGGDDYEELDFSAVGDGRRWEFTANGAHKIDMFLTCGGTGVAALGAAPADEWDTYEADITAFVDSLSCAEPADSTSESGDEPATAGEQVYPLTTKSGRMERAIRNHWSARLDGDYARAFGYYTGPVRRRVGLESSWAEQVAADGLTNVEFQSFDSDFADAERGRMSVALRTESDAEGCKDWDFTYEMVHGDGRWLIYDSRAEKTTC